MKLEKTVCPYCGAGLKIEYGQRTVECQYCKSTVLIQGDGNYSFGNADNSADNTEYEAHPSGTGRNRDGTGPAEGRPAAAGGKETRTPAPAGQPGGRRSPVRHGSQSREGSSGDSAPARRFNHLLPPPGFRTKNALHMIIAVVGYLLIIVSAQGMDTILDAVFFTGMSLSAVDIFTDWTGFFSGLPGVSSQSTLIRILMKIVWCLVISIAWALVMVSIQMILGM